MSQHAAEHEAQAQRILSYLKAHLRYDNGFLPRPFFVEFTGTPSSGKTTSIVKMYQFFRRLGFRVDKPLEGAEEIQHISRKTPVYNIRTGLYALTMLLDESHMHNFDIIMFDRGIFDAYVWMMYWREKEKLTAPQEDFYQKFFLSPFWADTVDLAFFMVCQPEEAMRREMQFALTERLGETTNPAAIATLYDRFQRAYDLLHPHHPQLKLVDTTTMGGSEMVDYIGSTILDALERRIPKE